MSNDAIHLAGDVVADVQRCARCNVILADHRKTRRPLRAEDWHAVGGYIEWRGWKMTQTKSRPTCTPETR